MTAPQQYTMNLGSNTGDIKTFNLGPGSVVPGSINVEFRDPNEFKHEAGGGGVWLHPSSTTWQLGVIEFLGEGTIDTAPLRRGSWGGDVGSVTYETGEMTLDLSKLQDYLYFDNTENVYKYSEPPVSNDWVRLNMAKSFVRVRWSGIVASGNGREWNTCLAMPNVSGRLREGKTMFEVFADKTLIVITHHLLGIELFDRVLFVEDGGILCIFDGAVVAVVGKLKVVPNHPEVCVVGIPHAHGDQTVGHFEEDRLNLILASLK